MANETQNLIVFCGECKPSLSKQGMYKVYLCTTVLVNAFAFLLDNTCMSIIVNVWIIMNVERFKLLVSVSFSWANVLIL